MTAPDATTQDVLHRILRCVASGTVTRTRTTSGWVLTINNHPVEDGEIQLGVSVLDAQRLVTWWPEGYPRQHAVLTLDNGIETLREWDHHALLGQHLRLDVDALNDIYSDGGAA